MIISRRAEDWPPYPVNPYSFKKIFRRRVDSHALFCERINAGRLHRAQTQIHCRLVQSFAAAGVTRLHLVSDFRF
jgi:hypothetical protein